LIRINNLNEGKKAAENSEVFSTLFQNTTLKIESIRSSLKTPGQLYNQDQDEWVLLLEGEAQLEIIDEIRTMYSGDYLFLPKHTQHRVLSTSENALWLAVFSS
jgi:cupin 2 domain-containing protein